MSERPPERLLEEIIYSLDNHSSRWKFTDFSATNVDKPTVITGISSPSTISILSSIYSAPSEGYGGFTFWAYLFGSVTPWRVRLYRSIKRARLKQRLGMYPEKQKILDAWHIS